MNEIYIDEIKSILPHAYPFLLVDRVTNYQEESFITGYKNITINEPFFVGHFPKQSVMPGVLIVEAMAQISGILALKTLSDLEANAFFLAGVDSVRFKKVVVPGDKLDLKAEVIKVKRNIWKLNCTAHVDGVLACSADIMITEGA